MDILAYPCSFEWLHKESRSDVSLDRERTAIELRRTEGRMRRRLDTATSISRIRYMNIVCLLRGLLANLFAVEKLPSMKQEANFGQVGHASKGRCVS